MSDRPSTTSHSTAHTASPPLKKPVVSGQLNSERILWLDARLPTFLPAFRAGKKKAWVRALRKSYFSRFPVEIEDELDRDLFEQYQFLTIESLCLVHAIRTEPAVEEELLEPYTFTLPIQPGVATRWALDVLHDPSCTRSDQLYTPPSSPETSPSESPSKASSPRPSSPPSLSISGPSAPPTPSTTSLSISTSTRLQRRRRPSESVSTLAKSGTSKRRRLRE